MKKEKIIKIFEILEKKYTNTETIELNYFNNYTLIIAVLLSAQATDKGVNKATEKLFQEVQTPEDMLKLGEENLKNHLKTLNYFNTKAKHIISLSKVLVEKFNSQVPSNREDLESLAGVGRKTANIILNTAFDKTSIAVDTHVFRVSNRIGLTKAKNVVDSEKQLEKNIPQKYKKFVNHWLVMLGRYICKARKPDCNNCPIQEFCKKN